MFNQAKVSKVLVMFGLLVAVAISSSLGPERVAQNLFSVTKNFTSTILQPAIASVSEPKNCGKNRYWDHSQNKCVKNKSQCRPDQERSCDRSCHVNEFPKKGCPNGQRLKVTVTETLLCDCKKKTSCGDTINRCFVTPKPCKTDIATCGVCRGTTDCFE